MAAFSYPSSWDFNCEPETGQQLITKLYPAGTAPIFKPPADSRDDIGAPSADDLDAAPIGFGKYRTRTPLEILAIDPGWLVWAKRETGRIICSDTVHEQAKRRHEELQVRQQMSRVNRRSGGFIPR